MSKREAASVEVEDLIETLQQDGDDAREKASTEIAKMGKPIVPVLIQSFREGDIDSDRGIAMALKEIGAASIPYLVDALGEGTRIIRLAAARALWEFEEEAAEAMPALIKGLTDCDSKMRMLCAHGLGRIGRQAKSAATALLSRADDADPEVRSSVSFALSQIGISEPQALSYLSKALQDPDPDTRRWVISHLEDFDIDPVQFIPLLIPWVPRIADFRDQHILTMLGDHPSESKDAVPHLGALIRDESKGARLRIKAVETLWKIDRSGGPTLDVLTGLLQSNPEAVCDAICSFGPEARPLVRGVIDILRGDDWDCKWAAVGALEAIGAGAQEAIPFLIEALGHESGRVASGAAKALHQIGPPALPHLIQALNDPNPSTREYAADGLSLFGDQAKIAIPFLERGLQDQTRDVRAWCAIALGDISREARMIPVLLETMQCSGDPGVLERGWKTIKGIVSCKGNRGWRISLVRLTQSMWLRGELKDRLALWTCLKLYL